MSREPDQSSGGSVGLGRISSQESASNSSTVPSKYCTSTVLSSWSTATTSNSAPCGSAYHAPIRGGATGSCSCALSMTVGSRPGGCYHALHAARDRRLLLAGISPVFFLSRPQL